MSKHSPLSSIRNPVSLVSRKILEGYLGYLSLFDKITTGIEARFLAGDWHGIHEDNEKRLRLYKTIYRKISSEVLTLLGATGKQKDLWVSIKEQFRKDSANRTDREIARTFFNSVCRKVFNHEAVDDRIMFILTDEEPEQLEVLQDLGLV